MSEHDRDNAEAGRVAAETGRVEAERDRVTAEGGAEHEESRREAEVGRVDAEFGRVAARAQDAVAVRRNRNLFLGRWGITIAIGVGFVCLLPSLAGLYLVNREIGDRCTDTAVGRSAARGFVVGGLEVLGYRYVSETGKIVPTVEGPNDYYAQRPAERDAELARTRHFLKTFPEIQCDSGWFG